VLTLASSGALTDAVRHPVYSPVDLRPRARTFAFPFGVRRVFGAKEACRDKCSVYVVTGRAN
jgi:hypothetical protein